MDVGQRAYDRLFTIETEREFHQNLSDIGAIVEDVEASTGQELFDTGWRWDVATSEEILQRLTRIETQLDEAGATVGTHGDILTANEETAVVTVTDSREATHRITVDIEGTIRSHDQDAYPPLDERNSIEQELIAQTERYARWLAYSDGFPVSVFPRNQRIPQLYFAHRAIDSMSDSTFREQFEEYFSHVAARVRPDISRPEPLPDGVDRERRHYHLLDVELQHPDSDSVRLASVSDPYLGYYTTDGEWTTTSETGSEISTVTIELPQSTVPTLGAFRELLLYHLRCQIRDCVILMGTIPGSVYRLLGPGHRTASERYESLPVYRAYDSFYADISGYSCRYHFGLGPRLSKLVLLVNRIRH